MIGCSERISDEPSIYYSMSSSVHLVRKVLIHKRHHTNNLDRSLCKCGRPRSSALRLMWGIGLGLPVRAAGRFVMFVLFILHKKIRQV